MAQLPVDFQNFFRFQHYLGQGSFGTVVQAIEKETSEPCAVKIISKVGLKPASTKAILREAEILESLTHPNIVQFRKTYDTPAALYLVMELVPGGTLTDLLKRRKLTEIEAALIIKGLLRAVAYLHSKDIVHRDLKPDNILIPSETSLSSIKVIDFGLSDAYSDADLRPLTGDCGTLLFVAPEQLHRKHYGKAVDVWSCGIILFMTCTAGKHPLWTEEDTAETYREKMRKLAWHQDEDLSPLAWSLFSRLTKVDPIQRYTPIQALAHPWISKKQSEIPLTSLEKIQRFNDELRLRKVLFSLLFLAAASPTAREEKELWEPVKRRGRSRQSQLRLPPISSSPLKKRVRNSITGPIIRPQPVLPTKTSRPLFLL